MNDKTIILQRISRKESEIRTLEAKLKDAKIYIQALRDVVGLLGGGSEELPKPVHEEVTLRSGSAMALARQAILKAGIPLYIDELLDAIGKTPSRESRTSLGSAISSYVRRGEVFTRPATSTFGLIELNHFPENEPTLLYEPPPGFGETNGSAVEDVIALIDARATKPVRPTVHKESSSAEI
jgi:hypothetical protein